jgi:hypothetical protein
VAQQFGVLEFPWVTRTSGQSAVGALGSGSYLEIFPSGQLTIPVPGASTGCPNNFFPYSIQVVNGGVLQRDKQDQMEKERILKSTPTMKF